MHTEVIRKEILRLIQQAPFKPFLIILKNGDQIKVERPENLGWHPRSNGSAKGPPEFWVLSAALRFSETCEAVAGVTVLDAGGLMGS
jgi:hypothetical protein